jgi:hypothetical protein
MAMLMPLLDNPKRAEYLKVLRAKMLKESLGIDA